MNGNERSTARDFDRDAAPDLSGDGWPEKFAKAMVRWGRPPVEQMKEDQMKMEEDNHGQPYIEWEQAEGIYKRAWVQRRTGEKDWAGTRRYLNVVRCDSQGHPGGFPADFPIYNDLPDEQVLLAFVHAVNAITGCRA